MKLTIKKLKCSSVNTVYAMHHRARHEHKKDIQKLAYYEALQHRKHFDTARITFTAHFKGKRKHDPDNLYVKPMMDALVHARVIDDDNNEVVQSVTLKVVTGAKEDFVEIEIL